MFTKILLFNSEHEAAKAIHQLQSSGMPASSISVLVSNVEHSRLLNVETNIHIDLFSEITSANRREHGSDASDEVAQSSEETPLDGGFIPVYAQQPSMQVPFLGFTGVRNGFDQHEQGIPSLIAYGISEEHAERCLEALRAGQVIVCLSEREHEREFNHMSMGTSEKVSGHPLEGYAATVLEQ